LAAKPIGNAVDDIIIVSKAAAVKAESYVAACKEVILLTHLAICYSKGTFENLIIGSTMMPGIMLSQRRKIEKLKSQI